MGHMKIDQASETWRTLVAQAEKEPVRVQVEDLPDVFVLSGADYDKFRSIAAELLIETMDRIGAKAKARGMTQEKLDELLADES